jgi:hypothetical protein
MESDYSEIPEFIITEVENMLKESEEFIEMIENLLKNKV